MTRPLGFFSWLLAFNVGCGADSDGTPGGDRAPGGGQTGEDTGCLPIEGGVDTLAWSERSPLGFSADEVLGSLGSSREGRLTWSDGASTTLHLELERRAGDVEFQTREWRDDGSGRELASGACGDALVVPVTLSFSTGDGAFAESWPLELSIEMAAQARGFYFFDLGSVEGSYVPETDTSSLDDVRAFIDVTFTGDGWSGQLRGQGTRSEGPGPDGTSSAQDFPIGTF